MNNSHVLEIQGLNVKYGAILALNSADIAISDNSIVGLLGLNGAGKTTTLKAIAGLLPYSGSISLNGENIDKLKPHERNELGISLVPEGRKIFTRMSVAENLDLGGINQPKGKFNERLEFVLNLFPILKERYNGLSGLLSGGEQQMLAIGRALMSSPKVLLLDEPTMGLSPQMTGEVMSLIGKLKSEGLTILIVEQKLEKLISMLDYYYIIKNGEISGRSDKTEATEAHRIEALYGFNMKELEVREEIK